MKAENYLVFLELVAFSFSAMASRVFGKWQKRNRSDDYTLLPDGEDNVSIETEEATEVKYWILLY